MDGVVESLVHKYRVEEALSSPSTSPSGQDGQSFQRHTLGRSNRGKRNHRKALETEAKEEAEGVFADIQALVGITDVHRLSPYSFLRQNSR